MFIKQVQIKNYRLFSSLSEFECGLNVPDGEQKGAGLTVFVGENGCGKSTLLDAIALPLVQFKAEAFNLGDINDPDKDTEIKVLSSGEFFVGRTMPKSPLFSAKGFLFKANLRKQGHKSYLSSTVVHDQLFIKADDASIAETSPDLRVNVNNPFSGKRFDENDVLILDNNRIYQTHTGIYNSTRFDRLMEDFDFQYIKTHDEKKLRENFVSIKKCEDNSFLKDAIKQFQDLSNEELSLALIDNWRPFKKAFFAIEKPNHQQIPLKMLGSGYEMIFSFLLSFHLSKQSGKQLICLIDEPELHLHPSLQERFVNLLLEASKTSQIIIATHSPIFVKQLLSDSVVEVHIFHKNQKEVKLLPMEKRILPYTSANEINYLAFNFPTPEYHDELYGYIMEIQNKYTQKEMVDYFHSQNIPKNKEWRRENKGELVGGKNVPLQVFIRNQIHHPENIAMRELHFSADELKQSIDQMIEIIKNFNDVLFEDVGDL